VKLQCQRDHDSIRSIICPVGTSVREIFLNQSVVYRLQPTSFGRLRAEAFSILRKTQICLINQVN
jgi:hypothetical protein